MNMNVQSHRRRPTLTCKGGSSAEHFYHSIRYCVWLSTTTNLSYRKQYALLRSTGVRVGGGAECMVPPQPRHWGGLCPPAPPPMFRLLYYHDFNTSLIATAAATLKCVININKALALWVDCVAFPNLQSCTVLLDSVNCRYQFSTRPVEWDWLTYR